MERNMAKAYFMYGIGTIGIFVITLCLISILRSTDVIRAKKGYVWLRIVELLVLSIVIIHAIVISAAFVITMRKKMFLYYVDHRKRLFLQIFGLLSLLLLSVIHVAVLISQVTDDLTD